jgi:hypothetical protein
MANSSRFFSLLVASLTLALLPLLATVSPATADQIWYQSVGRPTSAALCDQSSAVELAAGWTNWEPSWDTWVNAGKGGFVCNRQITWAYDNPPVSCATGAGAENTCVLGNTGPGGGVVFYVDETNATGSRYLEVAPSNWSGGSGDPALVWGVNLGTDEAPAGCAISDIVGTGYGIGDGESNTDLITSNPDCDDASKAPAAWAAKNYTGGSGTSDWYLPSWLELTQLCRYANRATFDASAEVCPSSGALVDGFSNGGYCSSSQVGTPYIYLHNFNDGNRYTLPKSDTYFVRPIRAF